MPASLRKCWLRLWRASTVRAAIPALRADSAEAHRTHALSLVGSVVGLSDILVLKLISVLVFILFCSQNFYYAALLPRRRPHIASHSVCPSVCLSVSLSVRPVIITERHVATPSELK